MTMFNLYISMYISYQPSCVNVTLDDITTLLNTNEENIKKFFKDEIALLLTKILNLEGSLSSEKAKCSRLDTEMTKIKAVIVDQQLIEKHEAKLRSNNMIIHNLPESRLADDMVNAEKDKLNTIRAYLGLRI